MHEDISEHTKKDIDYHEAIAAEYDRVVVKPRWASINALFRKISSNVPRHGRAMLDLGTGTGHMLVRFADRFDTVVAVDHSASMLSFARGAASRGELGQVKFVVADAVAFLKDDVEKYDLITCVGFLHHLLPAQRRQIFELARLHLADEGVFLVSEPVETGHPEPYLISLWNRAYRRAPDSYHVRAEDPDEAPLRREELVDELHSAGLTQLAQGSGWEVFPRTRKGGFPDNFCIYWLQVLFGRGGPVYWTCCRRGPGNPMPALRAGRAS